MNKTKIEWVKNADGSQGYTINPVKGLCPMACPYCYARRMYKRFKRNPEIRFDESWIPDLANLKKPSRIFVGSTIELFGDWIKYWWLKTVFDFVLLYPQHTFIFLTKQPQNLIKWSPFPENTYIGVSVTDMPMLNTAINILPFIKAKVKYLSFESLLSWECPNSELSFVFEDSGINWVIIGQQTPVKKTTTPKIEWIREIVEAADKAGIPVFLKDNLRDLLIPEALMDDVFWESEKAKLRQEPPNG